MAKREYSAPGVKKVQLIYKSAILGVCHSSPNLYPAQSSNGGWDTACYSQAFGCPQQPGGG